MLSNGKYVVLFNSFDMSGQLKAQNKMGGFSVHDGAITDVDGMCSGMIPTGPMSNQTELRIVHGLNTGYYEVRHTQGFRPRPLNKSEKLTLTKGPFAKFLRAMELDLAHGVKNVKVDRRYWVPGGAGYNLAGDTVYIDSRIPEIWEGHHTDKYLLIHECGEKAIMDKLGLDYGYAHNIILHAENAAVRADGIDPERYEKHIWSFIHAYCKNSDVPKEKRPPDLDPDRITHDRSIKDIMRHSLRKSRISTEMPRVASIAVADPLTGNLLFGKRNDNKKYTMPGGHLNDGESPLDGAKRELFEETGIAAKKLKFLGSGEVKSDDGKPLMIYSFLLEKKCDTDTEQDPDEEVQEWEYITATHQKKLEEDGLMHVPTKRNVTVALLGLRKSAKDFLRKADSLADTAATDEKSWYDQTKERISTFSEKHEQTLSTDDLTHFLDEALMRRDYNSLDDIFNHPRSTHEHFEKILHHPSKYSDQNISSVLRRAVQKASMNPEQVSYLKDFEKSIEAEPPVYEGSVLARLGAKSDPEAELKADLASTIGRNLTKNYNIKDEALDTLVGYYNTHDQAMGKYASVLSMLDNPHMSAESLDKLSKLDYSPFDLKIARHPNVSRETSESLLNHYQKGNSYSTSSESRNIKKAANQALAAHGVLSEDHQSVGVKFGLSKNRQVRDWVAAHGGQMHHKELAAIGLDVANLGMGHLKDAKGNIKSEDVQKHIDAQTDHEYIVSHDTYGYDPEEDYTDTNHPQHEKYKDYQNEDDPQEPPSPKDEQRHSSEPSQVFQLSVTPDHIRKMKDAGVWDTFKKLNRSSIANSHPTAPSIGIGWVRYTRAKGNERGEGGTFIDEIQSDIGSSRVRKTRATVNRDVASGSITPERADYYMKRAESEFPEDHYNKIKDIVFHGKEAGEVLHEAFHQHLRDTGHAGERIDIHASASKAGVSLGQKSEPVPVHMIETYDKQPKKMGYTPAKYGELVTQRNESAHPFRSPTSTTTLRKSKKKKK